MRTDADIIEGCLSGDRSAWNAFVDRFSRLIYWSIHKTIAGTSFDKRADFADEVFQDVFKRLLEKEELARLRRIESVKKFLCVMAAHMAHDRMRSLTRSERDLSILADSNEGDGEAAASLETSVSAPGPDSGAMTREQGEIIEKALSELTEKERTCIELHYLRDMTHKEIAGILGVPQDTVSSVIRRTREKLSQYLSRRGLKDF